MKRRCQACMCLEMVSAANVRNGCYMVRFYSVAFVSVCVCVCVCVCVFIHLSLSGHQSV